MVTFLRAGSSRGSLQRFSSTEFLAIESFHNFAFLGTDGEGTLPPPCSKLLAHSTFAVAQLPIHFLRVSGTEKRSVEKSSITVSVSDVFFNNLPDSLR